MKVYCAPTSADVLTDRAILLETLGVYYSETEKDEIEPKLREDLANKNLKKLEAVVIFCKFDIETFIEHGVHLFPNLWTPKIVNRFKKYINKEDKE